MSNRKPGRSGHRDEGRAHPAGRRDLRPEFADMRRRFPGILPAEFAEEPARRDVHVERDRRDADTAFEHVQLGADQKSIGHRCVGPNLPGEFRIANAGGIAHACQDPPGLLETDRVDQLLAQAAQRRGVEQQHAMLGQPDGAFLGRKSHETSEIGIFGIGGLGGLHCFSNDPAWMEACRQSAQYSQNLEINQFPWKWSPRQCCIAARSFDQFCRLRS